MADLIDCIIKNTKKIDDMWFIARPVKGPFLCRVIDAWFVLVGKADAVVYYKQD